jgi:hypothetical protein
MLPKQQQMKDVTVCRLCGSLYQDNNKIIDRCLLCNSKTIPHVNCNYVDWVLQREYTTDKKIK